MGFFLCLRGAYFRGIEAKWGRLVYEAAFKNIDDTLRKDAGCSSELDYVEQTSWVLFLKYLHDYETDKEIAAQLNGGTYTRLIDGECRWSEWAAVSYTHLTLPTNREV